MYSTTRPSAATWLRTGARPLCPQQQLTLLPCLLPLYLLPRSLTSFTLFVLDLFCIGAMVLCMDPVINIVMGMVFRSDFGIIITGRRMKHSEYCNSDLRTSKQLRGEASSSSEFRVGSGAGFPGSTPLRVQAPGYPSPPTVDDKITNTCSAPFPMSTKQKELHETLSVLHMESDNVHNVNTLLDVSDAWPHESPRPMHTLNNVVSATLRLSMADPVHTLNSLPMFDSTVTSRSESKLQVVSSVQSQREKVCLVPTPAGATRAGEDPSMGSGARGFTKPGQPTDQKVAGPLLGDRATFRHVGWRRDSRMHAG